MGNEICIFASRNFSVCDRTEKVFIVNKNVEYLKWILVWEEQRLVEFAKNV